MRRDSTIVESFRPGGPAETSELQSGDEILTIDGKAVKTYTDTAALIGDAGSVVTLTVRRAGVEQPLTIHIKRALVRWP